MRVGDPVGRTRSLVNEAESPRSTQERDFARIVLPSAVVPERHRLSLLSPI